MATTLPNSFITDEDCKLLDGAKLRFGSGTSAGGTDNGDVSFAWDGTDFDILQGTANSSFKWGIDGAGIDQVWYGDTASTSMTWDQSADTLLFADNAKIALGTGSDIVIAWDGTDLDVTQATANSSIKWGVDGAGIDHVFYGDTASKSMTWDQSADTLLFADSTPITLGTGSDATIQFDGTNLVISPLAVGGLIHVGDASDTAGNVIHVFDGGTDKPGALCLYDHAGVAHYLWIDNTGDVRTHTSYPTNEDADGTIVGTQS